MSMHTTGFGGFFFKTADPEKLHKWYAKHLGLRTDYPDNTGFEFHWREKDDPQKTGYTVLGLFSEDTEYFGPSKKPFMLNLRVENLEMILEQLRKEGVDVDSKIEKYEYGKFSWIMDPEGNRIELWEPPQSQGRTTS